MPARCRGCGPTICWPASSRRWWRARASRRRRSTTSRSAAPCQAGEDSRNVARHALLLAGLPVETPGAVHNRLCGSGLNALVGAAHAITCGEADVCIAGGVESMTRAPFVVGKAEQAVRQGLQGVRFLARRALPQPARSRAGSAPTPCRRPPTTSRATISSRARQCDEFALGSQQKYRQGQQGRLLQGRDPARVDPAGQGQARRRGRPRTSIRAPRPPWTTLQKLKPLFADGVTTAGNASGINDGAGGAASSPAAMPATAPASSRWRA